MLIAAKSSDTGEIEFRSNPTARDLLIRFVAVCRAIGFAHSRGVIHRDIKPGNIMLGDFGETLIVDWGLARKFAASQSNADGAAQTLPDLGDSENDSPDKRFPARAGDFKAQQTLEGTVVGMLGT